MRLAFKKLGLIAAVVVALVVSAVEGPAYAEAPTAYNLKNQWLTAAPTNTMPMSMVRREITLWDGTYGWYTYVDPAAIGTCQNFTGHILAGTYIWTDQLWPGSYQNGYYRHDSYLTEKTHGWAYQITCYFRLPSDGWYTWGSALDPHF